MTETTAVAIDVENRILVIRGQLVLLDSDLAAIYGVSTKAFNQAVKRGAERFPMDFAFQLSEEEFVRLRSQIVTSKPGRGGRRYLPSRAPVPATRAEAAKLDAAFVANLQEFGYDG